MCIKHQSFLTRNMHIGWTFKQSQTRVVYRAVCPYFLYYLSITATLDDLLIKKHAILAVSGQKFFASPAFSLSHLALFAVVMFILLAGTTIPFCYSVLLIVKSLLIS